jgi:hypothetical protein
MPRPRTQATLDKVDYARSLIQADPTITQAALTKAIKGVFGTGLSLRVLSNLKAGRDPFAKRARREPEEVSEPRYSGLYVLEEGPEKKVAEVLAKVPEVIVVAGERVLGCSGAEAEAKVLHFLEDGTKAAEIAVYRRRSMEVETEFEVRIGEGDEEEIRVGAFHPPQQQAVPETAAPEPDMVRARFLS